MNTAARQRIVIVGATSAIAEHCARLWIGTTPVEIVLIGRDVARVERVAADLRVRNGSAVVKVLSADFIDPQAIGDTVRRIAADGAIDIALIAHGSLPDQTRCEQDLRVANEAMVVNGQSPVLFAEALVGVMTAAGRGKLAVIGSVAGDRGRKSNYVYGAAKGLVERYVQGLQHRLAGTKVTVTLVKPGPTDTPMTAHLKQQGTSLAPVEDVARLIVAATDRGKPVVYAPGKWQLIMLVIRHLPRAVFNRMDI